MAGHPLDLGSPLDAGRVPRPRRRRRRSRCSSTGCWCTPGTPTGSARATCSSGPRRPSPCWRTSSACGRGWTSTPPSTAYVPELAGTGYGGVPVRDVAHDDQRRGLGGGPPRPRRPGHRARRGASPTGGSSRALLARVGPRVPARHPLRVLHGRLPGARLGARARHRRRLPRRARRAVARPRLHRGRVVAVDGDGRGAWPAAASPPRPATGPGSACSSSTARPGGAARPDWVEAPGRRCRSCGPAGSPRRSSTHAGFGYHWWPLDDAGARVAADGSRGQFVYVDRAPAPVVVKTSRVALRRRRPSTRSCRDLTYRDAPRRIAASHRITAKGVQPREPQGHDHLRADRRRRHGRQVRARARDAGADRRVRHRRGPGGRRPSCTSTCAIPQTGQGLARGGALPRGRRADPRQRRRRHHQHHRGHGRRPLPRPARPDRRSPRAPTWSAASSGSRTSRSCCPTSARSTAAASTSARAAWSTSARPDMLRDGRQADPGARRARRDGDLRHRAPVVRQPARRGGPDRRPADVPAVHGHPVRRSAPTRACWPRWWRSCPTGAVWASFALGPHADAVGGAVGAARRPRAGRPRGQPLPRPGRQGHQRRSSSSSAARSSRRWAPRWPPRTRRREILALQAQADDRGRVAPDDVRTVACVGAGVIGGGWVAYFLARGLRRGGLGPGARTPRRGCAHLVDAAWPALTELGPAPRREPWTA